MSFFGNILNSISGGLFGTLTGVGSGILGNYFAQKDAAQNQRYAKELMQYQYDLQQQGINAQNQYNLPSAQMERLRNAGLNPHLVYGSGSVVGNTSSAASASLGKSASINRSELVRHSIDAALQTQMNVAQVDNLKAQNENIKQQNNLIRAQIKTEEQKAKDLEQSAMSRKQQNDYWELTKDVRYNELNTKVATDMWTYQNFLEYGTPMLKKELDKLTEVIDNLKMQRQLTSAQIFSTMMNGLVSKQQISYISKLTQKTEAEIKKITKDTTIAVMTANLNMWKSVINRYGSNTIGTILNALTLPFQQDDINEIGDYIKPIPLE